MIIINFYQEDGYHYLLGMLYYYTFSITYRFLQKALKNCTMKPEKLFLFSLAITVFIVGSFADRILFLLPLASRSHVHVFEPLMRALGEKGHEIVALSPIHSKDMPETVKQIQLITVEDLVGHMPDPFEKRKEGLVKQMLNSSSFEFMNKACLRTLKSPKLHNGFLQNEKFDLVIVHIFLNHCVLGIIPHFQAASIFVSTVAAPSNIGNYVGNRFPQSFVPSMFLPYSDKMTFKERLINTVTDFGFSSFWNLMLKRAERMYREYLPNGHELPSLYDIQRNVSMLFMNSHFSLTYPRPLLPDVIEVGGMHTRPPKPLPKVCNIF